METANAFDQTFQKQEKEIVTEFGIDRVLQYLGVYLVIALGIAAKALEVINRGNISCYPSGKESSFEASFLTFAETYCWETATIEANQTLPNQSDGCPSASSESLLKRPFILKAFLQWAPYGMILQAFLFSLPSAIWRFRTGQRLVAHLKFMRLFLEILYLQVKDLPRGIYEGVPYDQHSSKFDPLRSFSEDPKDQPVTTLDETSAIALFRGLSVNQNPNHDCAEKVEMVTDSGAKNVGALADNGKGPEVQVSNAWYIGICIRHVKTSPSRTLSERYRNFWTTVRIFFLADLQDRHLFSMLCNENFSSLRHHPYVSSVFQLTTARKHKIVSMNEGILNLWCNKKNFSGHFLVGSYVAKHITSILISVTSLILMSILIRALAEDRWEVKSFRCDVILHEHLCVVCTIKTKAEMLALLFIDVAFISMYLALTVYQWIFLLSSYGRNCCCFFDEVSNGESVALTASMRERMEERKRERKKKTKRRIKKSR